MIGQKFALKNITLSSRAAKADTRLHTRPFLQKRVVGPDLGPNCLQRLSADDSLAITPTAIK